MPTKKVFNKRKRTPEQKAYLLSRIEDRRKKNIGKLKVETKKIAEELSILFNSRTKLNNLEQLKLYRKIRRLFLKVNSEVNRNVIFSFNLSGEKKLDSNKRANSLGNYFEDIIRYVFSMESKGLLMQGFTSRVFKTNIEKNKKQRKK